MNSDEDRPDKTAPETSQPARKPPALRNEFGYYRDITTRWRDNDVYGHVNNAVYYSYFDTVINCFLIERAGLDISLGEIVGLAVETSCRFHASFAYPETIEAGLAVSRLGRSSVRYTVGLFGAQQEGARADGHFVHVFVCRKSNKPVPIPDAMRAALETLMQD